AVILSMTHVSDCLVETGDFAGAVRGYAQTVVATNVMAQRHPNDTAYHGNMAQLMRKIGVQLERLGDVKGAIEHQQQALVIYETLLHDDSGNDALKVDVCDVAGSLASLLSRTGHSDAARPFGQRVLDIRRARATAPQP